MMRHHRMFSNLQGRVGYQASESAITILLSWPNRVSYQGFSWITFWQKCKSREVVDGIATIVLGV